MSLRGVCKLLEGLSKGGLVRLDLASCQLGEPAALSLATMLEENGSVKWLSVAWNTLSTRAAKRIGQSLQNNVSLEHLDMSCCGLGDSGGSHIVGALIDNVYLTEINLSSNSLGVNTCQALAASLRENSTLEKIHIRDNSVGLEGGLMLLTECRDSPPGPARRALPEIHLEGCNFLPKGMSGSAESITLFNMDNPNGHYNLDLSKPHQYQVAVNLLKLRAEQGPDCWRNVKLNSTFLYISDSMKWPQRMPEKGTLLLDFLSGKRVSKDIETMSEEKLWAFWDCLDHSSVTDDWRLELVRLMTTATHFSAQQADVIIRKFSWTGLMKQEAAFLIFGRLYDPQNLETALKSMSESEQETFMHRLGMLAIFHPRNPTGSYAFNLKRQLDSSILYRLLNSFSMEVERFPKENLECFRNVVFDGKPTQISVPPGHPDSWVPPAKGILELDFVSHLTPPASASTMPNKAFLVFLTQLLKKEDFDPWKAKQAIFKVASAHQVQGNITTAQKATKKKVPSIHLANPTSQVSPDMNLVSTPPSPRNSSTSLQANPVSISLSATAPPATEGTSVVSSKPRQQPRIRRTSFTVPFHRALTQDSGEAGDNPLRRGLDDPESPSTLISAVRELIREHRAKMKEEKSHPPASLLSSLELKQQQFNKTQLLKVFTKAISVDSVFRCDQLACLLEVLKVLPDNQYLRVECVVAFFSRLVKRSHSLYFALDKLSIPEMAQVSKRLGWLNLITWHHPDLHYVFNLSNKDDYEAAFRLAKIAMQCQGLQMWTKLQVNGKDMKCAEDADFWMTVSGGDMYENRILDFVFESDPLSRQTAAISVIQVAVRKFLGLLTRGDET